MKSKGNRRKKQIVLASTCMVLAVGIMVGLNNELTVRVYTVTSHKVRREVRIALLTDLHSCFYGEGQQTLLDAVEAQRPDVVLLGGDIVDDILPEENAWTTVLGLVGRYPTYYVTGNHEYRSGRVESIRRTMAECGVTVLAGVCQTLILDGQPIQICGVDDPRCGSGMWEEQLSAAAAACSQENFSLLLTHRPERVEAYEGLGFDLVLTGHAHGGQWRIPGLLNGFLAPDQGFFPKLAGGLYPLGAGELVVSRGLARESTRIPRIFNPPELVIIDVTPAD